MNENMELMITNERYSVNLNLGNDMQDELAGLDSLRENEIFPVVLVLPSSSIQEFSKYIKRLLSTGKKSDSVVTKLSLKKAVNKTGIAFSKVNFSVLRDLNQQEKDGLQELIVQIKAQSQKGSDTLEEVVDE